MHRREENIDMKGQPLGRLERRLGRSLLWVNERNRAMNTLVKKGWWCWWSDDDDDVAYISRGKPGKWWVLKFECGAHNNKIRRYGRWMMLTSTLRTTLRRMEAGSQFYHGKWDVPCHSYGWPMDDLWVQAGSWYSFPQIHTLAVPVSQLQWIELGSSCRKACWLTMAQSLISSRSSAVKNATWKLKDWIHQIGSRLK